MVANGETLQKIATLKAYYEDIKEEIGRMHEYKSETIRIRSELDEVKRQMAVLWKTHVDYSKTKPLLEGLISSNTGKIGVNFKRAESAHKRIDKIMENYPDMVDSYKQVKKIVIAVLISVTIAAIGITLGINIYF